MAAVKKNIQLSATRISSFLQCKKRYWLNYVERAPKMENPAFKLGIACHTALEYAGNLWKSNNLTSFTDVQKKEILDVYNAAAVTEGVATYEGFVEGRELVTARINNFALGAKIIGLEIKFGFDGTQTIEVVEGISLIGAIDKLIELDPSTLLVVDYKTSMTVPEVDKLRNDVQLSMYNLVVQHLFPEYERVILSLDMLRKGDIVYTYRTPEELVVFKEYLVAMYKAMSELKKKDAVANVNSLCGWCDYRNICEAYKEVCDNKDFNFLNITTMSDHDLITEWEHVRMAQKILETRERELSDAMIDKIKVKELPVKGEGKEVILRQSARTSYDPVKVSKLVSHEDFVQLVSLSPTKLKKYTDKNSKIKSLVDEIGETNYNSAFLASRKIKK